jgi:thioredoxin reductase
MINCDSVIIGAGPVGLFPVFEPGLPKLDAHVIDAVPHAGGQDTSGCAVHDDPALQCRLGVHEVARGNTAQPPPRVAASAA